jgi:DNA-binding CsgD family transcriptional regulator
MPRTRLRTASGQWLVLHASRLRAEETEGRIAVIFEEARPSEIAPLIVDAYGLTKREGEITRLVLRGLSTAEVSKELHITPNTVRDHFKAIFDKVGVRSRRELVRSDLRPAVPAAHGDRPQTERRRAVHLSRS